MVSRAHKPEPQQRHFSLRQLRVVTDMQLPTLIAKRSEDYLESLCKINQRGKLEADDVHDARVAGRRIAAALRLLSPILPDRYRKVRRKIQRTTQALGRLRDADVIRARLLESLGDEALRTIRCLNCGRGTLEDKARGRIRDFQHNKAATQTAALQEPEKLAERIADADLHKLLADRLKRVMGGFSSLRAQISQESTFEQLHAFRMVVKRLRYTLEIVLTNNGESTRLLGRFKALQDDLGELHDACAALERVQKPKCQKCYKTDPSCAVAERLQQIRDAKREDFMNHWVPQLLDQLEEDASQIPKLLTQ